MLLTPETREEELKEMMRGVESACSQLNMEVMGGHTEITDVVKHPLISVTGVGTIKKEEVLVTSSVKPGQDIVITKWIGLEGTSIAAKEKEAELLERFAPSFVETAKHFDQYLSVVPEAKIAKEWGVSAMHDITEGGVFGALWEMGSGSNVGLDIDLKKIPIRQETVEVCELLGLNPYILMSSGSMMIATDDGYGLVRKLNQAGIEASVIGKATDKNERNFNEMGKRPDTWISLRVMNYIKFISNIRIEDLLVLKEKRKMAKLNIVLFEPEIPANTGNIGRTCVATGTRLHLIEPLGFKLNEKAIKRAGMDYWKDLDVTTYINYEDFLKKNPGAKIYMATTKGPQTYVDVHYEEDCYIMFGKESGGIPEEILLENQETAIRIPMIGDIRSLNLSNSVAIVLYEALRQNNFDHMRLEGHLTKYDWK